MTQLAAWWRARTARERLLIQIAAALVFVLIVPAWAYGGATAFRRDAAADFANARLVSQQVASLGEAMRRQGAGAVAGGSVRERALNAAQSASLVAALIEPAGADRLRIAFTGADSVALYRWIELVGRSGVAIESTTITRVGESAAVNADFVIAEAP